jgi:hypothetical protein
MQEYQKIPGPYKRETEGPNRNKLIPGAWSSPGLEATAGLEWLWTEKVDGTNIRVHWDGHKVSYGGRTDNAQIPARLINVLDQLLPEELFEQKFGAGEATLYGEGYGAGIQKGGVYRPDMSYVLFDVRIDGWWLSRDNIVDVAGALGLDVVPLKLTGPIQAAIDLVSSGSLQSQWGTETPVEGLVGVTKAGLLERSGDRLIVKIKAKDFA